LANAVILPACVLEAGQAETDPDRRVLAMLGARGQNLPKPKAPEDERAAKAAL
jgi:hypothetical protein